MWASAIVQTRHSICASVLVNSTSRNKSAHMDKVWYFCRDEDLKRKLLEPQPVRIPRTGSEPARERPTHLTGQHRPDPCARPDTRGRCRTDSGASDSRHQFNTQKSEPVRSNSLLDDLRQNVKIRHKSDSDFYHKIDDDRPKARTHCKHEKRGFFFFVLHLSDFQAILWVLKNVLSLRIKGLDSCFSDLKFNWLLSFITTHLWLCDNTRFPLHIHQRFCSLKA